MAALTILACEFLNQLYDLSAALRSGFSISRSFNYVRAKKRQQLFIADCRAVWQREIIRMGSDQVEFAAYGSNCEFKRKKMQKNYIDFATIEASAEALDAVDNPYCNRRGASGAYDDDGFGRFDEIDIYDAKESDTSFYEYASLPVYEDDKIEPLYEGASFTITGHILLNCERFSINFVLDNAAEDVALHINPRLPQNYIVRNTKVRGNWGREEVSSALPFSLRRGSNFAIQVLVTGDAYLISVNGYHFAEFNHRLPYTAVTKIVISGDVENVSVQRSEVEQYPERLPTSQAKEIKVDLVEKLAENIARAVTSRKETKQNLDKVDGTNIPREWALIRLKVMTKESALTSKKISSAGLTLPYYGTLAPESLTDGRMLKIEGRVNLLPHSFYINLQRGQNFWPHPLIAFHFNPRFSTQRSKGAIGKAVVCRNAWYSGKWAREESSELNTDLQPGKTFSMCISCTAEAFEVYINYKLITTFVYHIKPDIVDTVYIQGDIKLWNVVLESGAKLDAQKRIYQNPAYTEEELLVIN